MLTIEQRLGITKYQVDDEQAHIVLHNEFCSECAGKPCLYFCPARCYTLDETGATRFDYVGCVECGTCRVACPIHGAIEWNYPRGGFGVNYRYG